MANKKTILITGASGMIGSRMSELLIDSGHKIHSFSRSCNASNIGSCFTWDPAKGTYDKNAIQDVEVIINLAGAGIADEAWTKKRKELIIKSRTDSINLIQKILSENENRVRTVISASAIGYYGDSGDVLVDENAAKGSGFLADSTEIWEKHSEAFSKFDLRNVILRIGIVLSNNGGAFKELTQTLPFRFLSVLGSGNQFLSWVHLDDICKAFIHSMENEEMKGIYNVASPQHVTNQTLNRSIKHHKKGAVLLFRVPEMLLNVVLGERASVVLNSSKVSSEKLRSSGFDFEYKSIDECVKQLLSE